MRLYCRLVAFAGCRYGFTLRERERWEDTALDSGQSKMLSKTVAFGHDNYGGRFSQEEIIMNGKGDKHNQ